MGRAFGIWVGVWFFAQTVFAFSYAALTRTIREHQVRSIDELLPLLPEDFRKHYTFVYQSRSLQAGVVSPLWPRVILYGHDARLILAFTKSPSSTAKSSEEDALEIIEFNDAKSAFLFRRIRFTPGKDPLNPEPEINPALCKNCHGEDPRPNWDSYNIWSGAYGSVSRSDCDTMQEGTRELQNYLAFLDRNRHRDRYRFLPTETAAFHQCPSDPKRDYTFRNAVGTNPNARFTDLLFDLNAKRIKRLIVESPSYSLFKYLWAGLAQNCLNDPESFFPLNFGEENHLPNLEAVKQELEKLAGEEFQERLRIFQIHNNGSQYETYRRPVNFLSDGHDGQYTQLVPTARFKFVADRARVTTERWETGFSNGRWTFTTPTRGMDAMFRHWSLPGVGYQTCAELAKKSVETLTQN